MVEGIGGAFFGMIAHGHPETRPEYIDGHVGGRR